MGRNLEPGISFYRMDAGHIDNKKIRLLFNDYGPDGYWIWCCLIDYAYKNNGYYYDLNNTDEHDLYVVEKMRSNEVHVQKVIECCIKRKLFSEVVYDHYQVLTSQMMQTNFVSATKDRREKGSPFEMVDQWLCDPWKYDKIPPNIIIVPPNNKIDQPNKVHRRIDNNIKDNNYKESVAASQQPHSQNNFPLETKKTKKRSTPRPDFIAPTYQEARAFFITTACNPNLGSNAWPEDKAANEADQFIDNYKAIDWKVGRNKMVDWQASARKWIRTTKAGTFDTFKPAAARAQKVVLNKLQKDINYLYDRYKEALPEISIINLTAEYYDYCKLAGLCNWTEDQVRKIRANAVEYCERENLNQSEPNMKVYMKKFGIIEVFDWYFQEEKKTIF